MEKVNTIPEKPKEKYLIDEYSKWRQSPSQFQKGRFTGPRDRMNVKCQHNKRHIPDVQPQPSPSPVEK